MLRESNQMMMCVEVVWKYVVVVQRDEKRRERWAAEMKEKERKRWVQERERR